MEKKHFESQSIWRQILTNLHRQNTAEASISTTATINSKLAAE